MAFERRIPEGAEPRQEALDLFSRVSLPAGRAAAFRVRKILRGAFRPGVRVLDIGTGPAAVPLHLSRACPGAVFHGLDISLGMLGRACQATERSGAQVFLSAGDGQQLPVREGAVDVVLCLFALHHMEDPEAFLREVDRVLGPEGVLLLIDFRRDMPHALFRFLDTLWQALFFRTAGRFGFRDSVRSARRPEEVEDLIRKHGLERFRVASNPVELFVTSRPT